MKAIYPGTFDPITFGHIDVIKRGSKIFSKLVVAIAENPVKKPLFSAREREEMVVESVKGIKNVEVKIFDSLLVDFMKKENANIILRGLRETSDFPFEFQQAIVNSLIGKDIESVFVMTSPDYFYITSSVVKEIASYNGDISKFVPEKVEEKLKHKFKKS
jgi:pantetheine-phosphate adenylyltransferase